MTNSSFSTSDGKYAIFMTFHPPEFPPPVSYSPHVEGPRGTEATKRYPRPAARWFSASANFRCPAIEARVRIARTDWKIASSLWHRRTRYNFHARVWNTIEAGRGHGWKYKLAVIRMGWGTTRAGNFSGGSLESACTRRVWIFAELRGREGSSSCFPIFL